MENNNKVPSVELHEEVIKLTSTFKHNICLENSDLCDSEHSQLDKLGVKGITEGLDTKQDSPNVNKIDIKENRDKNTDSPESTSILVNNLQYPEGNAGNDSSPELSNTERQESFKIGSKNIVTSRNNRPDILKTEFEETVNIRKDVCPNVNNTTEEEVTINEEKHQAVIVSRCDYSSINKQKEVIDSASDVSVNVNQNSEYEDEDSDSSLSYNGYKYPRHPSSIAGSDQTHCTSFSNKVMVAVDPEDLKNYRTMIGREYYSYYKRTYNETDFYNMYSNRPRPLPRGALLHFKVSQVITREDLKEALIALAADIAFIDFNKGEKEGWVRLNMGGNSATALLGNMIDQKFLRIGDAELVFRAVTGKDEIKYLKKVAELHYLRLYDRKSLKNRLKKRGFKYLTEYNN